MAEVPHEGSSTGYVRARLTDCRLGLPAVLLVALLWRLPSFFDPPWVNDEGTYFAVAQAMAHGYSLYTGVWENKPPAVYLVYGAVYHLFGPSLVAIRLLTASAVLVLVWRSWHLAHLFFGRAWSPTVAVLTGLVFGVPFLEGTTGNAEVFVALLAASAVEQGLARKRWWFAGALMGIAVLFKTVAVFDASALGLTLFGAATENGRMSFRRGDLVAYVGTAAVVAGVTSMIVARDGILRGMVDDAFLYDLGYVGHGNGGSIPWLLGLKAALLLTVTIFAWRRPFPVLWLVFATLGALLSGRVFGHYLLQPALPAVLTLILFVKRKEHVARRLPIACIAGFLAAGLLSAAAGWGMAVSGHDSILARRLQYYPNFVRYAARLEPYAEYENQIDDHVLRNEYVARRLRVLPPGRLLVWANTPWIYPLSGRLPATRFTSALRSPQVPGETRTLRRAVQSRAPAIVVVIRPPAPPIGRARQSLHINYRQVDAVGTAYVYVRVRRR